MSDIGVVVDEIPSDLKQKLLLFDAVAFVDVELKLKQLRMRSQISDDSELCSIANDIEFLASKNLIYTTSSDAEHVADFWNSLPVEDKQKQLEIVEDIGEALAKKRPVALKKFKRAQGRTLEGKVVDIEKLVRSINEVMLLGSIREIYLARFLAKKIQFEGHQAVSLLNKFDAVFAAESEVGASGVIQVVLDKIPLPNANMPWEAVLDFRSDPKTKQYLNGLRTWMADSTKGNLSRKELEQKLEWLLFQQSEHIRLHRMVSNLGTMSSIFVASMEMLEDLTKLRFGNIGRSLVSFSTRKADLLKSELSSPAKEITYLLRVGESFGADKV